VSQSESGVMDLVRNGAIAVAILVCVGLIGAQFVGGGADNAKEVDAAERDATVKRIQPVGVVNIVGEAAETSVDEPAAVEATAATAAEAPEEAAAAAEPKAIDGEALYKVTCFACHSTGAAGAPIVGNAEAWAPRIATGKDALLNSALHGKGAMPAKGGAANLSDEEVTAIVVYMMESSK